MNLKFIKFSRIIIINPQKLINKYLKINNSKDLSTKI